MTARDRYLTPKQVAKVLGVVRNVVYTYIKRPADQNPLQAAVFGGKGRPNYRILKSELERWLEAEKHRHTE